MSTEPQQTPTKEQLKKLAGAPTLHLRTPESQNNQSNSNTHQNLLEPGELNLDNLRSVRPISARAIPKALFTALLLSPVFLVAFVFVNGIKLPSKNNAQTEISKVQRAESAISSDASDETTQLRKQLAEANAQLALIQQQDNKQVEKPKPKVANSKAKPVIQKRATPTRVITRTATPVPQVQQPVRRIAVSTPPQPIYPSTKIPKSVAPKPTKIAQSNEYRPQTASVKSNKSIPVPTVKVDPLERWQQLAQLGSHGGISAEVPQESVVAENFSETSDNSSYQPAVYQVSSKTAQPEKSLTQQAQQPPAIEPELEAPILQGQPQNQRLIQGGTQAKAVLVTPLTWEGNKQAASDYFTIVLSEPLLAADESVVLPAQTQLITQLLDLSEAGIVRLVAVTALFEQDGELLEIPLPQNAVQVRGTKGKPLIAKQLHQQKSRNERLTTGRSALSTIARGLLNNSLSDVVENEAETLLDDLEERDSFSNQSSRDHQNIFFLSAGTQVEVFINQSASLNIPTTRAEILESHQVEGKTQELALNTGQRSSFELANEIDFIPDLATSQVFLQDTPSLEQIELK